MQDRSVTKCTAGYDYGAAPLSSSASQWYANAEHQFNFDVLSPFTLDSVTVRFDRINYGVCGGGVPSASGVFNILIKNSGGATLATINPVVPCGSGAVTVQIPIGYFFNTIGTNYRLEFGGGTGTAVYYFQNGAVFPKTDCSLIQFNNTSSGDTDDWGGFFNWKLRVGTNNCGRTPVQAILNCSLPLDFISFDGYRTNGTHKLIWTTNNEVNTHLFLIQRSDDGISFETIGQVEALNIGGVNHYTFTDPSPLAGINYYQLIQIDVNRDRSSSNIVKLSSSGEDFNFSFYPNPSENDFHFNFNNPLQEEITIKVYNPEGKLIRTLKTYEYDLSFGKELSAGIYFVTITCGQTQKTTKLFKN